MLGGLYGDLPPPAGGEKGEDHEKPLLPPTWANNKLTPIMRMPAGYAPPPSVLRAQSGMAPPSKLKAAPVGVQRQELPYVPVVVAPHSSQPAPVVEEYDPARPNDYDDYCRERRRKKMEEEMRREMERRRQEDEDREKEMERQKELALQKASQRDLESSPGDTRSSALGISGEEAWRRRAALSAASGKPVPEASPSVARSPSPPASGLGLGAKAGGGGLTMGPGGQMSAAERMMAKMGWKAGEGLGKDRQGITTPLMARKTDKRAGVIVNASAKKVEVEAPPPPPPPEKKPKTGVAISGPATRVLLLRNMVGRGEVDDDLEEEVAGECTKYGTVTRVLIFEITDPNWPPTESVRIFIEFERSESAMKGLVDLDGRFFGGRVVRASFFDEDKFAANQLAPVPGEAPVDPNIMPM
eukprot:TRINITY_DN545_c0_g1_i1.p1 TRINITY_DN545_c0_g1~~TRINITY_DN545_c0_g1_i1.p1  ORF type:complete len:413 (-),score=113.20 TRINITY_DN545_c0_g1_i1:170-1408(-)